MPVRFQAKPANITPLFESYFSFPGTGLRRPSIVDFELANRREGKVEYGSVMSFSLIDGNSFLSSNRWLSNDRSRPRLGRRRLLFDAHETFLRITKAKTFAIKLDGVEVFSGETQKQALSELFELHESHANDRCA